MTWFWSKLTSLLSRFRWYRWCLYQWRLRRKTPRTAIANVITIYATEFGDDATGDGTSLETAYRTLARAMRDIPQFVPPGTEYRIDVTGLHKEKLPTECSTFASDEAERRERDIRRLQDLLGKREP